MNGGIAPTAMGAKVSCADGRCTVTDGPFAEAKELVGGWGVLEVIYLIFNEGYSATAGEDWMRPALCADALQLSRILAQVAATDTEVHGSSP